MTRRSSKERIAELEAAVSQMSDRLSQLEESVADRAPSSEIERLNYAFELIADRAPASEIERLNYAFELICDRAPASEIERVNQAYEHLAQLAQTASESEERLDRVTNDILRESERINILLEDVERALPGPVDGEQLESFGDQLSSRFDALYHRFENLYRGSRAEIIKRMGAYHDLMDLSKLREVGPAVDLGAGRGEWVEFLSDLGFQAYGVDLNEEMASSAAERGLTIRKEDILTHLRSLPSGSVGIISMFHVAEHLEFDVLVNVIRASSVALSIGGVLLIETPNPTNLVVGAASFYLDPTHVKPIHPLLLKFLMVESGLQEIATEYLNAGTELPLEVPMSWLNDADGVRLIDLVNRHILSPFDYVVIGYKS
jgi:SAM-dependent methyltransferase